MDPEWTRSEPIGVAGQWRLIWSGLVWSGEAFGACAVWHEAAFGSLFPAMLGHESAALLFVEFQWR